MTSLLLQDTGVQKRRRLVNGVAEFLGRANVRAFYLPDANEGTVMPDAFVAGSNWTHGTAVASRLRRAGNGWGMAFNGTSDYVETPDRANLSFGNGTVDSAFTVAVLVNVGDTAVLRRLCIKGTEYALDVSAADKLSTLLVDTGGVQVPSRLQDVALTTQGIPAFYSTTYSAATGGATAANDVAQYVNGALVASTATNSGTYVAMGDKATAFTLMATTSGASGWAPGVLYAALVIQKNLVAADHLILKNMLAAYCGFNI